MELSEEELEKLVEKKVEERFEEEREYDQSGRKKSSMNRRQFLKKLGAGTLGLGALSLAPTSALNIRSNGLTFYGGNSSGTDLDVDNSGNVSLYGDLTDNNSNTIWDSSQQHVPASALESSTGPWEEIYSTTSFTGSSPSISWNTSTNPDYTTIKVIFSFGFDTSGGKLYFQLQEDSSGSYAENYVDSRLERKDMNATSTDTYIESNNQHCILATDVNSNDLYSLRGDITIHGIRDSNDQWGYYSESIQYDNNVYAGTKNNANGYGVSNNTYKGIRVQSNQGSISRGKIALYGLKI
ncbi:MAG: hypothetical protein ACI8Z7_000530 [Candidatus Nanohaloarchaea archaeon]|jgi:hypothetical protein